MLGTFVAVAVAGIVLDILTKLAVVANLSDGHALRLLGGLVYFRLARNTGAAFNLGEGYTAILTLFAVAVIGYILLTARRLASVGWAVGLGLILAGATGNLIDRLTRAPGFLRGAVVDFISLFGPDGRPWPIFNVADSCLTVGVITIVVLIALGRSMDGTRSPDRGGSRRSRR